jgi:Neuraminidase (sialidase)
MRIKIIFAFLFVANFVAAQPYKNIKIHEGPSAGGPEEPSIFISPKDTNIVVAGANINNVYYSKDGGRTWVNDKLESRYGVWGDPVIIANEKGHFYFFHLSDPTGENWASEEILDRIVVQRSKDGGESWNRGWDIGENHPKDQDKEWADVHPNTNNLICTWTEFDDYGSKDTADHSRILFSKSWSNGRWWSKPVTISDNLGDCLDDDNTTEGAVPAWGLNEEIYVAWSYDNKIWFDRSLDGGKNWLENDKVIAKQPGGWAQQIPGIMRCNGFPVTVVDRSEGPNRGRVYVTWTDQRNGEDDTDVWIVSSDDSGKTWSDPVRINDDNVAAHQFLTWLDVDNSTGYLYSIFYDRRNHQDNKTDVYMAVSKDGGKTWNNQKISESPFTPQKDVFFGDYNNISAQNGMIRPIWTSLENNKISVWTAIIYGEK